MQPQRILQPGEIEALDRTRLPRLRLPQPASLFADRAARLRQLAEGNPLADYLRFIARLVDAQHQAAQQLAPQATAQRPDADAVALAQQHGMPLLPAAAELPPTWLAALQHLLTTLGAAAETPAPLRHEITRLRELPADEQEARAGLARGGLLAPEDAAWAPLLMAALQVGYALRASQLTEAEVPTTTPAPLCPVCGTAPVASVLRLGSDTAGLRHLHCGLCATEWHMVRVKCSHCESTAGVRYQGIAGDKGPVLAETCDACGCYRKQVDQHKDPLAEPLADDLASLTLDLLMSETRYARASAHPLLQLAAPGG